MVRPIVTVGVCVKDSGSFIKSVIESILSQNYPYGLMQIVVIDGHSRDETLPLIKQTLSGIDVETKFLQEDRGLGFARQLAVDNADGDYILWVDGDMLLSEDYIRDQVEFMMQNPSVGVAGGAYGTYPGHTLVSAFENIIYVVDSLKYGGELYPRLLGTEGSIFRIKAIRDAGGFDTDITGAGEDIDLVYRIRKRGWLICMTKATFYEKCKEDWKGLWRHYMWWGYGGHYLFHKDRRINPIHEMLPCSGFVAGLLRSSAAYRLTHRKVIFLVPFHYLFKRSAWCYGFLKAHLDGYQNSTAK